LIPCSRRHRVLIHEGINNMKVLIIRFSSIGDIVLTTPVIRGIKVQCGAEIHFATKEQYAGILAANPHITKIHRLGKSLWPLVRGLRKEKFDYVIDLHHNLRTAIVKLAVGVKAFSFDKLNLEKWLIVNFKINRLPKAHIVDRYLATATSLGVRNDHLGLDYFIPDTEDLPQDALPQTHRNGYVAYAIGGQHETKKLPVERMVELCRKIERPIVLLGSREDFRNGEHVRLAILEAPASGTIIYNACGTYSLHQSASILRDAQFVFTHDTGLMHIAAAFKRPVYVLWGNTIPAFGMYPYQTKFTNLENTGLSCRPCSKIGFDKCPRGHFKCMRDIVFDAEMLPSE
jgi:ADP-heptose:LPS heptosyltransferase